MRRRTFITLVAAAASLPVATNAQQTRKVPRVGVLWHAGSAEEEAVYLTVLQKSFNDLGYIEGKTITLEHRFPAEQPERFRLFARELVDSKVDVIIAVTSVGVKVTKELTQTIPIVGVLQPNPVGDGLIESLAHPGGNVTGLSLMGPDLSGKRLALLKEMVPTLSRFALLVDPSNPASLQVIAPYSAAAEKLGLQLEVLNLSDPSLIDQVFASIADRGFDGVVLGPAPMIFNERARIVAAALAHKLPTEVFTAEMMPFGGLLSYAPDIKDYFRRAAEFTDKILKGAKPADLPVEQPAQFKMVISAKVAKTLGLTIPPSLLSTADEVIE